MQKLIAAQIVIIVFVGFTWINNRSLGWLILFYSFSMPVVSTDFLNHIISPNL